MFSLQIYLVLAPGETEFLVLTFLSSLTSRNSKCQTSQQGWLQRNSLSLISDSTTVQRAISQGTKGASCGSWLARHSGTLPIKTKYLDFFILYIYKLMMIDIYCVTR